MSDQPTLQERIKAKLASKIGNTMPIPSPENCKPSQGGSGTATPKKGKKKKGPPPPEKLPDTPPRQLRMKCGHVCDNRICFTCKQEKTRKKREAAQARKMGPPAPAKGWRSIPKNRQCRSRLPHGSQFESDYDANHFSWIGTLSIPETPGLLPAQTFKITEGSIHNLFIHLDDMYRDWLERQGFPTGVCERLPGMARDGTWLPGHGPQKEKDNGREEAADLPVPREP